MNIEENDENPVIIKLYQIQENGQISITRDTITVYYEFLENNSCYFNETNKYKRIFTYDELLSLDSAIDLLKQNESNYNDNDKNEKIPQMYNDFQDCFKIAHEIQKRIRILHNFGKTFVYEDHLFRNLNKEDKNISISLETLVSIYRANFDTYFTNNWDQPEYPPFLTTSNLLYFGSLLQRKEQNKIEEILLKMFPFIKKEILESAYNEATMEKYIIDPIKSSIQMFSIIYTKLSPYIKYSKLSPGLNHKLYGYGIFIELQEQLFHYFCNQNFLVIKVDTPIETFHVLKMISLLLYNTDRNHYFYENFFCYEDSDINSYFLDFEKDKYHLQTQYSFIIHPEFLSSQNQNILKKKFTSRMTPIPDMTLQKFVIITSSSDFIFGMPPEDLNNRVFTLGETSIKVDSNLMRNYFYGGGQQFYFLPQIRQSSSAGNGKSTYINKEIEEIIKINKKYQFRVFHHFIFDGNQRVSIESFHIPNYEFKNIIHFQFNDEIMQRGIKFWSHLYQLFYDGFVLPDVGEPMIINDFGDNLVFFEIPQLGKNGELPIKSLSEFPLPLSNEFAFGEDHYLAKFYPNPISIEESTLDSVIKFTKDEAIMNYCTYGINSVVKQLKSKTNVHIDNLKEYILLMYKRIFKHDESFLELQISLRKLGYIINFLHKYTKLYINSITNIKTNKDQDHFTAFFYILTVSSFYAYDCLPIENDPEQEGMPRQGLTFLTVNDLFCDQVENNQKKIHFYTTKNNEKLFEPLRNFDKFEVQENYFTICFNYDGKNPAPQNALREIFCSSEYYEKNVVEKFTKMNPQSYISRTQMTVPTLFRFSIILSRIFLSQPIILSGDTGCGKTSSIMLLFEYFKLPINEEMNFLNIEIGNTLNCHGGITTEDIINHLKNVPKSSKKLIVFFDKLNTSPASSYIEYLLLNEDYLYHSRFVFIGALNPWKKKNPISSNLTKVGLTQIIKGEEKKVNLIKPESNKSEDGTIDNMADMMYHVHRPQEATQDIIFNFNPICYEEKDKKEETKAEKMLEDDKFYPKEERDSIHLIIDNVAKYPERNRKTTLDKLKVNIDKCIVFIRKLMNERAVISYRDIERTMTIYNELFRIYEKCEAREINPYVIPTITAIISFALRLPNDQEFDEKKLDTKDQKCSKVFKSVFDFYFGEKSGEYGRYRDGKYRIDIRNKLLSLLDDIKRIKKDFMTFVYQYTLEYVKIDSIWKFQSTFIHIFIMDICIRCKLPCFIIGMPGTSKLYSFELLKKQYGEKLFVSNYLATRMSSIEGIKSLYYDAVFKEIINKKNDINDRYYAVFINKIGNANLNPSHPLNFLHEILDHGLLLNENGERYKVATIGISNNPMDFGTMNRGVFVNTDLPDLTEILTVFAIDRDKKQPEIRSANEFIDYREYIDKSKVGRVFDYLWPEGIPKTIALRSIYSMQDLISYPRYDIHIVCRILRELFNSKRLNQEGNYKDLMSERPTNIRIKDWGAIDNMTCFIERICCPSTNSNKSLSLFTKNYEAIEYFKLFEDDEFIKSLNKQFGAKNIERFAVDEGKFKKFRYRLSAEDFKKSPNEISQDALKNIIECISKKYEQENVLFIGNHPCFDSCLDLLNVPHKKDQAEREVTLGSVFSSKFLLTNTDFYIMMIANIDDLKNNSKSENPFSFAFLDRTETIYLDWEMIGPYYLKYKFPKIKDSKLSCNIITEILNKQVIYETKEPEYLHLSIQSFYDNRDRIEIGGNKYLSQLLKERFSNGIKSVILTKSKILEDIYLPDEIDKKSILIENDTNIENFDYLEKSIEKIQGLGEKLIIIKCSNFDNRHFVHLKTFFDQITDPSITDVKYNIFIIYYGCDPKEFENLSTFRWPIFSMEDISIHPELESKTKFVKYTKEIKTITNQLTHSQIEDMKTRLNKMTEDSDDGICHNFFSNLFDKIIQSIENDIREKTKNNSIEIIRYNYEKSDFKKHADFYDCIKQKFDADSNDKYFDIDVDETSISSSTKTQIITQVYRKLYDILQQFFIFRFGSSIIKYEPGIYDIEDYLLKCRYLQLSFDSFLHNPGYDVFFYLFKDYFEFLLNNQASFDDVMIKRKCIADRLIAAFKVPDEVHKTFELLFNGLDYTSVFNTKSGSYILDLNYQIDNDPKKSGIVFMQTYIDYFHLRSIAGLNVKDNQNPIYWKNRYLNDCLFPETKTAETNTLQRDSEENKLLNRNKMIESIADFRNKSIFEIFISPIEFGNNNAFESNICQKLISTSYFEIDMGPTNDVYKIYKEFNENDESLMSENRLNKLKGTPITDENRKIILSMLLLNAESKWDGEKQDEVISKFKGINGIGIADLSVIRKNIDKIKQVELNQDKYKLFGKIYQKEYKNLDWNFKGNECLIDRIHYIINKGSSDQNIINFRKWLFCGFDTNEPLSIIAFRRFLSSQTTEYKDDLVKVLDPFFGNPRIFDLFVEYIDLIIPDKDSFPIGKITDGNNMVMNKFTYQSTFKFPTTNLMQMCIIESEKPYLAQFVWFHILFNKPSDYPLITLIIKESSFFIDFKVVPKIINSILHLRHLFSYNTVFIPIILHCTSLFDDCDCKLLLYSLCFDTPNKDFENIQNEVNEFKLFLKQNYSAPFEKLRKKSSYDQIKFILKIYFKKYNEIIEQINKHANKAVGSFVEEVVINAYDVLPNMLITNLTLTNIILPLLYKHEMPLYEKMEECISKIFVEAQCFKSFETYSDDICATFPLFKVSFENENGKDFLGFSPKEYECLFKRFNINDKIIQFKKLGNNNASLNYHASILSFFLHIYLNKKDDDYRKYIDIEDVNDISNIHLNTYAFKINYDFDINAEGLIMKHITFDKIITIMYEENKIYPLQGIFKLLPNSLRDKIRGKQKDGFNVIQSEDDLFKEEPIIEEEEEKEKYFTYDDDDSGDDNESI